ncbi:septum site-determining protein MinC [Abyssibacter profundi]|nr:septum site-determining protein MinC [Abyssibacter profundi]
MSQPDILFKGRVMSLTVLRINTPDPERITAGIEAEVTRAPKLFSGLPVLIDPNGHRIDLPAIADAARTQGLVPVAVVEADEDTAAAARGIGLGVLQRGALDAANGTSNRPRSEDRPAARIVDQPVRSGQQLYARGTDLIIRAAVSPGAEVLADGSIHVYGALRGRALAGCRGEESARIFCQSLEAELVAIAGNYLVAEDMASEHRKQPSMVRLSDEKLTIETL